MPDFNGFKDIHSSETTEIGYKEIIPDKQLTDTEVEDYWNSEFQASEGQADVDSYDCLLSEVFNRCEEDIRIDFEPDGKLLKSLESFSAGNWKELSYKDRIDAITDFADVLGKEMNLENPPKIVFVEEKEGSYGGYILGKNQIEINSKYLDDPEELVDTIAHEMRHAYQHYRADILETKEDALFRINFDNYITPVELPAGGYLMYFDYYGQYVEADARAFANKITEAIK